MKNLMKTSVLFCSALLIASCFYPKIIRQCPGNRDPNEFMDDLPYFHEVDIAAHGRWESTGIKLEQGQRLGMVAVGEVVVRNDVRSGAVVMGKYVYENMYSDPAGVQCYKDKPKEPLCGRLMARIGKSGEAFPVSNCFFADVVTSGELYLRVENAIPTNNDFYTVFITYGKEKR